MYTIACMYVTLMPVIFMGIFNMVWCKTGYMKSLCVPIDGRRRFCDGERIFGDNKTWKGFIGYVVIGMITAVIWGGICGISKSLEAHNYLYINNANDIVYNILVGLLFGLAYALFEFPNSFLKRRLRIAPGRPANGIKKILFIVLDQADSLFGCVLVVCVYYHMSVLMYLLYVTLGALTHIVVNMLLYALHLRKNRF